MFGLSDARAFGQPIQYFDNAYSPLVNYHLDAQSLLVDSSGNGLDLTQAGSAGTMVSPGGLIRPSMIGFDGVKFLERSALTASLAITGAMSVLFLVTYAGFGALGEDILFSYSNVGETEADNILYQMSLIATPGVAGPLVTSRYFHEHGAGVNDILNHNSGPGFGQVALFGFTRSAPAAGLQTVNIWDNGGLAATGVLTAASGGTAAAARFRIGSSVNDATRPFVGYISNFAIWTSELTQAQVEERFNFCLGGRVSPRA
jgi:hypothetical protein